MSNIIFCSDLHLDHKRIPEFRKEVMSCEHNTQLIMDDLNKVANKRSIIYFLGDVAFSESSLSLLGTIPGTKYLIRGNHDRMDLTKYSEVFKNIFGLLKYKQYWLSHAPIHPNELRGRINLHGHAHYKSIDDSNYFNCCVENLLKVVGRTYITLDELRKLGVTRTSAEVNALRLQDESVCD